jgi:hypothetical protein
MSDPAAKPQFKRSRMLVKQRLQFKVILTFIGISSVAALFQVYLLSRSLGLLAERMPKEGDLLLHELPMIVRSSTLLSLSFLVPFMAGVGLVLTHRIAGPIYRFETYLSQVVRGEHTGPVRIRKGDEFQTLCTLINDAVGAVESRSEKSDRQVLGQKRGNRVA